MYVKEALFKMGYHKHLPPNMLNDGLYCALSLSGSQSLLNLSHFILKNCAGLAEVSI
jgi:hypothetical protein